MDAKKQETLLLFVVAVVGVKHLANLPHDITGLHGAGGPHTPSESEGAGFTVFIFPFLIPRYMATVGRKRHGGEVLASHSIPPAFYKAGSVNIFERKTFYFEKKYVLNRQKQQELVWIKSCFTQLWCISTWDFLAPVCLFSYEGNKQHEKKKII